MTRFMFHVCVLLVGLLCLEHLPMQCAAAKGDKSHVKMQKMGTLASRGDLDAALVLADELIAGGTDKLANVYLTKGHILTRQKKHDLALLAYKKCVEVADAAKDSKERLTALTWQAVLLRRAGKSDEAIVALEAAYAEEKNDSEVLYQLAFSYLAVGRLKESFTVGSRVLRLRATTSEKGPTYAPTYTSLSDILAASNHWKDLTMLTGRCLVRCKFTEETDELNVRARLAVALEQSGKKKRAQKLFKQLRDEFGVKRLDDTIEQFHKTMTDARAVMRQRNEWDDRDQWIAKALKGLPAITGLDVAYRSQHFCQWEPVIGDPEVGSITDEVINIQEKWLREDASFDKSKKIDNFFYQLMQPFQALLFPEVSGATAKFISIIFSTVTHRAVPEKKRIKISRSDYAAPSATGKLRLGVYTADVQNEHPMLRITRAFLKFLDKSKFEIILFTLKAASSVLAQLKPYVSKMVDLTPLSETQASLAIYKERPQVLMDMTGRTGSGKPMIMANKAAPVVVAWGGFPGTSGDPSVDYLVTDPNNSPLSLASLYTERLLQLPGTWLLSDHQSDFDPAAVAEARKPGARDKRRASFGLPSASKGVVFANFNRAFKFDRLTFNAWCTIVRRVPNSVLLVMDMGNQERITKRNLQSWWRTRCKLDEKRLVFMPKQPVGDHIVSWTVADLVLDVPSYNGGMTTVDALFAGVPHLAIKGGPHFTGKFPQLMGSSLLHAAGLGDLVVPDLFSYVKKAIAIGNDKELLARITKRTVAAASKDKPSLLFDAAAGAGHIGQGVREAYRRWYTQPNGLKPDDHIVVLPDGSNASPDTKDAELSADVSSGGWFF